MLLHPPVDKGIPKITRFLKEDLGLLSLSVGIQMILGVLFGHIYDIRIFMATGFLVATGQNPYFAQDLSGLFHNPAFQNITTIGYPPPWALLLGLIYRGTFSIFPNFLFYNFAIKIPIILANIALAYLTAGVVKKLGTDDAKARKAWILMLLNPFLLYATSAWGQFDSLVAYLALASLILLDSGKIKGSAILLALAISFKPTAFPLIFIPFLYLKGRSIRQLFTHYGILIVSIFLFCVVPFVVFGWDPSPILHGWNAHFSVAGGMSALTFLELIQGTYQLSGAWWLVGILWIPALAFTVFLLRRGVFGAEDLLIKGTALMMVFFLTRAWLSEPNIVLVLPFMVILSSINVIGKPTLAAIWILPLIFSFFNAATAQLFFPSLPAVMDKLLALAQEFRTLRLIAKIVIVIPWQMIGWRIVLRCLQKPPVQPAQLTLETIPA
jgi:hypothetical protein